MRPCVCHFFCVILQRKIKVLQYLAHAEGYVFRVGDIQDILKKASYALCFGFIESGKFTKHPKHCSTRCPLVCK